MDYVELLGESRTLSSPMHGYLNSGSRFIHVPYLFAYTIWTLGGNNDLDTLTHYRPAGRELSDDGVTLGGAFGARIFGNGGYPAQFDRIVELLHEDRNSQRLYCSIIGPHDDPIAHREYPCASGVHFFVRQDSLECIVNMRAQQVLTIFPYDLFLFSAVHQFASVVAGLAPGRLHWMTNTSHIYQSEMALARSVIDTSCKPAVSDGDLAVMPAMSFEDPKRYVAHLESIGREARYYESEEDAESLYSLSRLRPEEDSFTAVSRYLLSGYGLNRLGYRVPTEVGIPAPWEREFRCFVVRAAERDRARETRP